ncbi:hypothetical protein FQR65_LT17915 [Abscondita terminalis]|nr:hypothetical protein FQR65_LT17915 [Abscondita terminalis]
MESSAEGITFRYSKGQDTSVWRNVHLQHDRVPSWLEHSFYKLYKPVYTDFTCDCSDIFLLDIWMALPEERDYKTVIVVLTMMIISALMRLQEFRSNRAAEQLKREAFLSRKTWFPVPHADQCSPIGISNICFMGTNVISGSASAIVVATGSSTYFGTISKTIVGERPETAFDKGVNKNIGAMDVLCTDKTGTLTMDKIVLEKHLNVHGAEDDEVLKWAYLNSYHQMGLKNLLDKSRCLEQWNT